MHLLAAGSHCESMVEFAGETPLLDTAPEKDGPFARRLCICEKDTILVRVAFARYGRQNRSFEENATQREKRQDCMAERVGFEPTVEFPQHTLSKRAP